MEKKNVFEKFAQKFAIDVNELKNILKATAFKLPPARANEPPAVVSDEQMVALLIVSDQYGLNPFVKEIYAFPDKSKGIVPIVGIDGWVKIINAHPQFNGVEFKYSDNIIQIDDDAKPCPEWIEAVIYRKDIDRPLQIKEYLDECYRPAFTGKGQNGPYTIPGPWQSHTKRFLRHKALIQCARIALGFAGIYDEDETKGIIDVPFNMVAETPNFNAVIEQHGLSPENGSLNAFLNAIASQNRLPLDTVKGEAVKDIKNFLQSLASWRERQLAYVDNTAPKEETKAKKMPLEQQPENKNFAPPVDQDNEIPISGETIKRLNIALSKITKDRDEKLKMINEWLAADGCPPVESSKDLKEYQGRKYTDKAEKKASGKLL